MSFTLYKVEKKDDSVTKFLILTTIKYQIFKRSQLITKPFQRK